MKELENWFPGLQGDRLVSTNQNKHFEEFSEAYQVKYFKIKFENVDFEHELDNICNPNNSPRGYYPQSI